VRRVPALAAALALMASGCGDDAEGGAPRLVVSAGSSMGEALEACAPGFRDATLRLQLAGSDELAAQIRQGVKPDVYAAANTSLPEQLHDEGLLSRPVEFATNTLVLAVPAGSEIGSVGDLTREGVTIAIGSESVPVGAYTRERLALLPPAREDAILANVRSNEPDVKGIVGKLTQGAADAGFVYVTDVEAAGDELEAIELPTRLEPEVTYAGGVVEGAAEPEAARAFVDGLTRGPCADALGAAGFGPPPR
jgi:molybdate transport system substrate-binding protein